MKQKILPILILALATIAIFVYIFFPPPWGLKEIEGCMDPTSKNYNSEATINDESCIKVTSIPNDIIIKLDSLVDRDWDEKYYNRIENYIYLHYQSKGKSGSSEEDNAKHALDLRYMQTLNKATKKEVDNCFKNSLSLEIVVDTFFIKYSTESKEIKEAKYWFNTRLNIYYYSRKVTNLIAKRYNETSYNKLKNNINTLKNSSNYKKIRKCPTLLSIINTASKELNKFEQIEVEYKMFLSKDKEEEFPNGFVPYSWEKIFIGYIWYQNEIEKVNQELKYKYNLIQTIESLKEEILSDQDDETLQAKEDELEEKLKELQELKKIE